MQRRIATNRRPKDNVSRIDQNLFQGALVLSFWSFLGTIFAIDHYCNGFLLHFLTASIFPNILINGIEFAIVLLCFVNIAFFMANVLFDRIFGSKVVAQPLNNSFLISRNISVANSPSQTLLNSSFSSQSLIQDQHRSNFARFIDLFHKTALPIPQKNMNTTEIYASCRKNLMNHSRESLQYSDIYTDEQLEVFLETSSGKTGHFSLQSSPPSDFMSRFPYQALEGDEQSIGNNRQICMEDLLDISQTSADFLFKENRESSGTSRELGASRADKRSRTYSKSGSKYTDTKSFKSSRFLSMYRNPLLHTLSTPTMIISFEEFFNEYKLSSQEISVVEENVRRYISLHIIKSLVKIVDDINDQISKVSSVRLGVNSIGDIKNLMVRHEYLVDVITPVLHYFNVFSPDQEYFLAKLKKWAKSDVMYGYSPVSRGDSGFQWPDLKVDDLNLHPTEGEMVFKLFSAYMDGQISPYPISTWNDQEKPFSVGYVVDPKKIVKKPPIVPYYVEMDGSAVSTTFRFCAKSPLAFNTVKATNAVTVISALLVHIHCSHDGCIDGLEMEKIGLDLDSLLR